MKREVIGSLVRIMACAVSALPFLSSPTLANFAVCNQSFDVINVAIGRDVNGEFQTDGWWTIGTNQCANVLQEELDVRYIYVFAQDVFGQPLLSGTTQMCVDRNRFTIRGTENCWVRGHLAARFIEVDTVRTQRWSLFVAPP